MVSRYRGETGIHTGPDRFNALIRNTTIQAWIVATALMAHASLSYAQDLEPRRWSQMPTGLNFVGLGVLHTTGDIFFDPVLEIEDAGFETNAMAFVYLRSFGMFGKSSRIDFLLPYASGRWEGLLQGEPASTRRRGFADPRIRLSTLLYGGSAQTPKEFKASKQSDTVVGAAISVQMPFGEYQEGRLINLGQNRWVIRPQIGITHVRGRWTYEATGSVFWYSDNDDFFGGNKLENDLLAAIQGHVIYTWKPGLWASASAAMGNGADPTINGLSKDTETEKLLVSLALGVPINRKSGLKFFWIGGRTQNDTGADFDSFGVAWSLMF